MPHQDDDNLCTPLQDLKSLLELPPADQLHDQPTQGNASINAMVVAVTAIVTLGWTKKDTLTERFQTACDTARRLFPNKTLATTRQGLFSALGHCGAQLLKLIRAELIERHKLESCWLLAGRPTFAVDGSQFAVPRSSKNLDSRTPENIIIEMDWTMLAIWYSLYSARSCIKPGETLSGVKVFRAIVRLIVRVATNSMLRSNVREDLSKSVVADESGRKSDKNSKGYPRKKKQRETGEPTINEFTDE